MKLKKIGLFRSVPNRYFVGKAKEAENAGGDSNLIGEVNLTSEEMDVIWQVIESGEEIELEESNPIINVIKNYQIIKLNVTDEFEGETHNIGKYYAFIDKVDENEYKASFLDMGVYFYLNEHYDDELQKIVYTFGGGEIESPYVYCHNITIKGINFYAQFSIINKYFDQYITLDELADCNQFYKDFNGNGVNATGVYVGQGTSSSNRGMIVQAYCIQETRKIYVDYILENAGDDFERQVLSLSDMSQEDLVFSDYRYQINAK